MKTISHAVPMALCPINFKDFDNLLRLVDNDIDAALLFAKIKFHQLGSRIIKNDLVWIARSREALGAWFGFSIKKVDRLLKLLSNKGLIQKRCGLWYGQKRLYIAVPPSKGITSAHVEVNVDMLEELIQVTGSVQAALLFARIAFAFTNTKIEHDNKPWCAMTKERLSQWLGTSLRTIHTLIEDLLKKGLLIKQKFNWNNKTQCHFHIPPFVIDLIVQRNMEKRKKREETKVKVRTHKPEDMPKIEQGQSCLTQSAKKTVLIKLRSLPSETNNNLIPEISTVRETKTVSVKNDIKFNQLFDALSKAQEKYLSAALTRTLKRENIKPSSPQELWDQLVFALTNKAQLKGVQTFKHAVSRFMKIIADKNWRTPFGFYKHAINGQVFKEMLEARTQDMHPAQEKMITQGPKRLTAMVSMFFKTQECDETKTNALTNEAIKLAKQVKFLQMNRKNDEKSLCIASRLLEEITRLVLQGANKDQVMFFCQ